MEKEEIRIPAWEVEYPGQDRIEAEKSRILDAALPEKKSFWASIKETCRGPGLRVIFCQCGSSWLIGVMVYLVVTGSSMGMLNLVKYKEFLPLMAFPMLYLTFSAISYWSEEQNEMIELKQTMKYSFSYLISLRMFWASVVSVLVDLGMLALFQGKVERFWTVGAVGISSLFLFSMASLFLYQRFGKYYHVVFMAAAWFVLCSSLAVAGEAVRGFLFETVPLGVHVLVAAGCFAAYINMFRKVESGNAYAY